MNKVRQGLQNLAGSQGQGQGQGSGQGSGQGGQNGQQGQGNGQGGQIGQTGVTVHPKVYIACGISGQIQHIAGMQDSGIIISVNNDPDAPINKIADYVINGNVEDVVPKLIKYYKQNSK